jgi:hypothetical protein
VRKAGHADRGSSKSRRSVPTSRQSAKSEIRGKQKQKVLCWIGEERKELEGKTGETQDPCPWGVDIDEQAKLNATPANMQQHVWGMQPAGQPHTRAPRLVRIRVHVTGRVGAVKFGGRLSVHFRFRRLLLTVGSE